LRSRSASFALLRPLVRRSARRIGNPERNGGNANGDGNRDSHDD
jgi:hypothetical protein